MRRTRTILAALCAAGLWAGCIAETTEAPEEEPATVLAPVAEHESLDAVDSLADSDDAVSAIAADGAVYEADGEAAAAPELSEDALPNARW